MLPEFLLTETTVREAGTGPEVALGEQQGGTLVLTLGITRIIEQESIDIHLAIPPYKYGGLNVTAPMQNADTRYLAEMVTARDENTGLNERQVQVARKNMRLLVDAEARAGTPSLHVARVRKTAAGLPELSEGRKRLLLRMD